MTYKLLSSFILSTLAPYSIQHNFTYYMGEGEWGRRDEGKRRGTEVK